MRCFIYRVDSEATYRELIVAVRWLVFGTAQPVMRRRQAARRASS